jgi:2-polyprenyl-3-methyl-5-hydroxy-6-metoxy-1,4-benzoquinol methylase
VNKLKGYTRLIRERTKYRRIRNYIFTNALKYFAKIINQNEDAKVLDYGCGNTQLKSMISYLNYYGFDIDVENEKANYHSLEELEGRRFEYIVLSPVLEHRKSKQIEETNIFKWFLCILNGEWIGTEFGIIAKKYSKRVGK